MRLAAAMALGATAVQWAGIVAEDERWLLAIAAAVGGLVLLLWSVRRLFPPGTLRLRRGLPSVVAFKE